MSSNDRLSERSFCDAPDAGAGASAHGLRAQVDQAWLWDCVRRLGTTTPSGVEPGLVSPRPPSGGGDD